MHTAGFGLGQHPQFPQFAAQPGSAADHAASAAQQPGMADPSQIQQLVQLLGAKMLPKQTAVVECPKSMVGRVIGKGGETIKSLQQYTGAMIQIDQSTDPTRVTIAGSPQSLQLAVSMVNDIVRGTFKGFAMLRQIAISTSQPGMPGYGQPQPVYVQGYGFVPPSQVYNPDDPLAAAQMLRSSPPTGPLTPPMTPLRASAANNMAGLTPETLAALLSQQQQGMGGMPGMQMAEHGGSSQDALLGQLLGQLAGQQQAGPQAPTMNLQQQHHQQQLAAHQQLQAAAMAQHMAAHSQPPAVSAGSDNPLAGADQATIQALLAQAGLLGAGQSMGALGSASASTSTGTLPPSTSLMLSASVSAPPATTAATTAFPSGIQMPTPTSMPLSIGSSPAHSSVSVPVGNANAPYRSPVQGIPSGGSYLGTSPTHSSTDTGSGRTSPAAMASANPSLITRRPGSDNGSPLGRYGAVGSPSSQGAASSGIGAAAEEALAAKMSAITTRDLGSSVAEQGMGAGMLPPNWAKVTDGQGLVYYVNHVTQESSLTRPSAQGQTAM